MPCWMPSWWAIRRLRRATRARYQGDDPAHIAFYVQPGGMPHNRVMRSLERFGAEVIPALEKAVGPLERIGGRRPTPAPTMGQAA